MTRRIEFEFAAVVTKRKGGNSRQKAFKSSLSDRPLRLAQLGKTSASGIWHSVRSNVREEAGLSGGERAKGGFSTSSSQRPRFLRVPLISTGSSVRDLIYIRFPQLGQRRGSSYTLAISSRHFFVGIFFGEKSETSMISMPSGEHQKAMSSP